MVIRWLSRRQTNSSPLLTTGVRHWVGKSLALRFCILFVATMLSGCHSWPGGTFHGPVTGRVIEFKSGTAYITEGQAGQSTQAVTYEVGGDKVVLQLPFTKEVLRRMPDGTLLGMGETLVQVDPRNGVRPVTE